MSGKTDGDSEALERVASVVERIAVLLSAGVAPSAAWHYLAESPSRIRDQVERVVACIESGMGIAEAILERATEAPPQSLSPTSPLSPTSLRRRHRSNCSMQSDSDAWRGLAAAWMVATEAGAPLSPSLRDFSLSLRSLASARRAASTALSAPAATARLVMVLPVIGVLFGVALGFDTLGTLLTTSPGLVCLVTGCMLLWAARGWNRRLLRAATTTELTPGLVFDLLAIAVSGGASIERARSSTKNALQQCGLCHRADHEDSGEIDEASEVLSLSQRAGVPAGTLLRSEALRVRREAASSAERKAATLAVTLMLPLGVCVLPAFMLLGVAPLMIAVLSSTMSSF